jgi:hypothetical protein
MLVNLYIFFKLIPLIIIALILVIAFIYIIIKAISYCHKENLLISYGFEIDPGLPGRNIAYEFQAYYRKGNFKIHHSDIECITYEQLKKYLEENKKEGVI